MKPKNYKAEVGHVVKVSAASDVRYKVMSIAPDGLACEIAELRPDGTTYKAQRWDTSMLLPFTPDVTQSNLSLALLDQRVAGEFSGKDYAYMPVIAERGWALGIAVANEQGYNPISGVTFETQAEARTVADGMNAHVGRNPEEAMLIVVSSMGGRRFNPIEKVA